MNIGTLSWKSLLSKPWAMALTLVLFALGIGLVSFLLLVENQVQQKFEKNLAGVDLVIGAKGSPLQLILSSMYHVDAPTGNISIDEVRPFLNPKHPLIESAVPLSMGDSYKGYRIVGTTTDIVDWYDASVSTGRLWQYNFETVVGHDVAKKLNLSIGSQFKSSHGLIDDEDMVHDDAESFEVVGILAPSGAVIDQLILTTPQSFWLVHDHDHDHDHDHGEDKDHSDEVPHDHDGDGHPDHDAHDHDHDHDHGEDKGHSDEVPHDHDGDGHPDHDAHDHDHDHDHGEDKGHSDEVPHDHDGDGHPDHGAHDHDHDHDHSPTEKSEPKSLLEEAGDKEITSLLLQFKGHNFQALNMQRSINENTDMQAATPAIEINRLFSMMDSGERLLRLLALVIVLVSGLSIFISLYNSLSDRKYELALMRSMGARPRRLFAQIISEGLLLSIIGCILGLLLSHLGLVYVGRLMEDSYRYQIDSFQFLPKEWLLVGFSIIVGFLAALIPAIQASRTDIADTLVDS